MTLRGEIECPWRRSRVDSQSVKVTQGPAKVDVKTYEVTELDGKILVRASDRQS